MNGAERKEYKSGMWSEREGSKLTWGKGGKSKSHRFGADDTITLEVPAYYHPGIKQAGHTIDLFCIAGGEIAARTLIPEIEFCIGAAREQVKAQKDKEKTEFEAALAIGEAFRTVQIADQYGCELSYARTSKPGEGYAEWVVFGFAGSPRVEVERAAVRQVIGDRKSCGQFPGCSNLAYRVTKKEWDKIIELSKTEEHRKAEARKLFEVEEAADIQRKKESGYCFACESYCHGDCGHYSNDPYTKFRRDFAEAQKEANYGINEGE